MSRQSRADPMDVIRTVWPWRNPIDADERAAALARSNRWHGTTQAAVGATIGLVIFSLPWWWSALAACLPRGIAFVAWSVSGLVLITALVSPNRAYAGLQRGINAAARVFGAVLTFMLMTPIFVLFFVPFRLIMRGGRRDRLQQTFPAPDERSFWVERAEPPQPLTYRRQF